ncbi:hypothetical protein QJS10_CPB18g01125 [Acorus calamus]|uniref:Secreted protein n=1 Tax=Acorus calamus TaxID=4465 RepID=A0AAV9CQC2_ACOCL|nr:hypothetical protein QJS10_CPB18g01125 [Acorus calamus]
MAPFLFLLAKNYVCANLVLVDCKMEGNECVFGAAQKAIIVVGYNTFCDASWLTVEGVSGGVAGGSGGSRWWVVKVDECSGEEHVFRIMASQRKGIRA